jgi:23S rRNA (cytidine1920-2'-O)/16S rRNA (cytidine1409-2'-O)-methyltransferase
MLQKGALKVYAVDVGYNQLDEKLRRDSRVVVMEQLHAKDLSAELFQPLPDFVTVDVSFISAKKILDSLKNFLPENTILVLLVKPQFEVGPELVEKGGVVRDEALQMRAVDEVLAHGATLGFSSLGVSPSVLRGAKKGNQEYFALLEFKR